MGKNSTLNINGNFSFYYHCDVSVFNGGTLTIGSGYANYGTQIRCAHSITIGNKVAIANKVVIIDSDFHTIIYSDGTIVAAHSVVTKDVPPNCIVAGNPAKIIKEDIQWIP